MGWMRLTACPSSAFGFLPGGLEARSLMHDARTVSRGPEDTIRETLGPEVIVS